jgi:hypothetical protein
MAVSRLLDEELKVSSEAAEKERQEQSTVEG